MGEGGGAGNGQNRVDKVRCPMCRHALDGLRSKVKLNMTHIDVITIGLIELWQNNGHSLSSRQHKST